MSFSPTSMESPSRTRCMPLGDAAYGPLVDTNCFSVLHCWLGPTTTQPLEAHRFRLLERRTGNCFDPHASPSPQAQLSVSSFEGPLGSLHHFVLTNTNCTRCPTWHYWRVHASQRNHRACSGRRPAPEQRPVTHFQEGTTRKASVMLRLFFAPSLAAGPRAYRVVSRRLVFNRRPFS